MRIAKCSLGGWKTYLSQNVGNDLRLAVVIDNELHLFEVPLTLFCWVLPLYVKVLALHEEVVQGKLSLHSRVVLIKVQLKQA